MKQWNACIDYYALCIQHTICIDTSTNTYIHACYAFAMHFTMLFSTGYAAVYTYTQTHLHELLVANYTGNGQSTV